MRISPRGPLLLIFIIPTIFAADEVSTQNGNLVLEDSQGRKTTLTHTGLDSDPWISTNGRTVVFLRHSAEDTFRSSVYEIDIATRKVTLLYRGPAQYSGHETSDFGRPELDQSKGKLYLLSHEYATEGALIAIQLASGEVELISEHVVVYDIVACPEYRGDLIVLKRDRDILGRPYFLYWLYSDRGERLRLAGADELDVDALRNGNCGEPQPPVSPPPMNPSAGNEIWVNERAMDRQLLAHVDPIYPNSAKSEHVLRIPAKANTDSGGNANGIPGRRRTVLGA